MYWHSSFRLSLFSTIKGVRLSGDAHLLYMLILFSNSFFLITIQFVKLIRTYVL
nr:MAG TPA: hypothetical protein [Caudoviricetes sp.]